MKTRLATFIRNSLVLFCLPSLPAATLPKSASEPSRSYSPPSVYSISFTAATRFHTGSSTLVV